jgi:2-oxo-4-hydroxy-4-carboxy--5-ureidoimidazoline (OHCU) decarboxylase
MPAAGEAMTMARLAGLPSIDVVDALPPADATVALVPLFEGAPRFIGRLVDERPFGSWAALFERAREIAARMPEAEQTELINAHPRLGAPPGSVSALSYAEQGYDADLADAAPEAERVRVRIDAELAALNGAYEARFGFRYCVFVAGRPRAALLPEMRSALAAGRDEELHRALDAVVDIAEARLVALQGS